MPRGIGRLKYHALSAVIAATLALPARAQTFEINTTDPFTGLMGSDLATGPHFLGQTFTTPTVGPALLESITLIAGNMSSSQVQAFLYRWSDAAFMPVGPELWTSGPQSVISVQSVVLTPNILLTPSQQFVLILARVTTADNPTFWNVTTATGHVMPPYREGELVFGTSGQNTAAELPGATWTPLGNHDVTDLYFRATISVATVPEPATLVLVGAGLTTLGFALRRRRSTKSSTAGATRAASGDA